MNQQNYWSPVEMLRTNIRTQTQVKQATQAVMDYFHSPPPLKWSSSFQSTIGSPFKQSQASDNLSVSDFILDEKCPNFSQRCYCEMGEECSMFHEQAKSQQILGRTRLLNEYGEVIFNTSKKRTISFIS